MVACCNAQAGQTDDSDLALAQGQEALNELRDMGWDEAVRYTLEKGLGYRIETSRVSYGFVSIFLS